MDGYNASCHAVLGFSLCSFFQLCKPVDTDHSNACCCSIGYGSNLKGWQRTAPHSLLDFSLATLQHFADVIHDVPGVLQVDYSDEEDSDQAVLDWMGIFPECLVGMVEVELLEDEKLKRKENKSLQ